MKTETEIRFRLHACPRCHGDLISDEEGFVCLQCGRTASAEVLRAVAQLRVKGPAREAQETGTHRAVAA